MTTYRVAVNRHSLNRKLPHGDPFWPVFNASFENLELEPFDLGRMIYDGHAFTTWHSNNWRHSKNFLLGQHLALDFDTEDQRSTLPVLMADRFIGRYASLLYTTPSHTPEKPRTRVVFLLDTPIQQAKNYTLAAQALIWSFGFADSACKDPARSWWGSLRCEMEIPYHELPLEVVKRQIAQFQEAGRRKQKPAPREWHSTPDQAEVADALRVIPPQDIDYDEWVAVLMAIHREFGEAGLSLAENWADGAPGEVPQKWRSFNASGNVAGVVGLGTVFALAQRFGWSRAL